MKSWVNNWVAVLLVGIAISANGANPNAGLPSETEYTTDKRLETHFASVSLSELETAAQDGEWAAQSEVARRYLAGAGVSSNTAIALVWFQKAAANGFALAQQHLGLFYAQGTGVSKDFTEAAKWFQLAADQGVLAAAKNLGIISLEKMTPTLQPKDALRFYELAAEKGDLDAAVRLADPYSKPPWGGSIDTDRAVYWLSFAAARNYLPAFNRIGWCYMQGTAINRQWVEPDYEEARRWFNRGAEQNDEACQYGLGMWEWNVHAEPNLAEIRNRLLQAAAANYSEAFYQLGRLCALEGVNHSPEIKANLTEAAEWYRRGADHGNRRAAAALIVLISAGTVKSPTIIADLRQAVELDDANSKVELAVRYLRGEAQARNEKDRPLALIQSAMHMGNARAMLLLSDFYAEGNLVKQDRLQAMEYLFLAAVYHSVEAYDRIAKFREAANTGNGKSNDLRQAFLDYTAAIQTSQPGPAATLARRYLDGTYALNSYQAFIWFSVAAKHADAGAAEEARRLLNQFDIPTRAEAQSEADAMFYRTLRALPGF